MENNNKISDSTFSELLYLSRLSLPKEEQEALALQVNRVVGYFDILDKFADTNDNKSVYKTNTEKELRSNDIHESLPQNTLKKMSSEYMDNYFRVPKVLGSGA